MYRTCLSAPPQMDFISDVSYFPMCLTSSSLCVLLLHRVEPGFQGRAVARMCEGGRLLNIRPADITEVQGVQGGWSPSPQRVHTLLGFLICFSSEWCHSCQSSWQEREFIQLRWRRTERVEMWCRHGDVLESSVFFFVFVFFWSSGWFWDA